MYLFDTDAVSALVRIDTPQSLVDRMAATSKSERFISVVTLLELRRGSQRKAAPPGIFEKIERKIISQMQSLPVDSTVAVAAADLMASLDNRGIPIGLADSLIGATAVLHRLTLVTGNIRHFSRISGLKTENWLT